MSAVVAVERSIHAAPEALYDLVADLPAMGQWSPENEGGEWIGGADGPTVGARFKGHNSHGTHRWITVSTVVVAGRPDEFTFDVKFGPFPVARWSFRFERDSDATKVTQTWTDHRSRVFAWIGGKATGVADREPHNEVGMQRTLEALAAAAEAG